MSRVKARDTTPEMVVRRFLHTKGLRYRLHVKSLPGTPDLVFTSRRLALFVHGCFWHRHSCCANNIPKSRPDYWREKFNRNLERDKAAVSALKELGWSVLIFWECETKFPEKLEQLATEIIRAPLP